MSQHTSPTIDGGYCMIHRISYYGACPQCSKLYTNVWQDYTPPVNPEENVDSEMIKILKEILEEVRGLREIIDK
jgi:hypothetical protein